MRIWGWRDVQEQDAQGLCGHAWMLRFHSEEAGVAGSGVHHSLALPWSMTAETGEERVASDPCREHGDLSCSRDRRTG